MSISKIALLATAAFAVAAQAQAATVGSFSTFASGSAVQGTGPDSVSYNNGSLWVEYGNGTDSTGITPGNSTIVQYSSTGAIKTQTSVSGSVDGLKVDPTTGLVWALQNQDANSTLSLLDPTTGAITTGPLKYAAPPYQYGSTPTGPEFGRGYDDVAFLGSKVFLSNTNPSGDTNPNSATTIAQLDQGHTPAGTLTTSSILKNSALDATGKALTINDPDSLKATPDGRLVQSSGDDANILLVTNPGTATQSVSQIQVQGAKGGLDDVLFLDATRGTLYFTDTSANLVYSAFITDASLTNPLVSIGSLHEIAEVAPDGTLTPLFTGLGSPHGLTFVADAPEPAMLGALLPAAGLLLARRRR